MSDLKAVEIPLSDNHNVVFLTTLQARPHETAEGMRIQFWNPFYVERLDDRGVLVPSTALADYPWEFHACINMSALFIAQYNKDGVGYEGEGVTPFNYRAIMQSISMQYGCEINSITKHYANARLWLSHTALAHPATLEELLNAIAAKTKRRVIT